MNTALTLQVRSGFIDKFKTEPLLIFSPGRINIIGEHTDYNEGFVFPAAVNKGIVAAFQKNDSDSCEVYAINKDETIVFDLDNIRALEKEHWGNYVLGVITEIQKTGKPLEKGFNIVFGGDIPGGAGMSSSAALENSIVFGLNALFNLELTKQEMILISQQAEHNYVGVKCGIMDQYASMFGIKNNALLLDCRAVESTSFEIDFKDHELILINTNVKHSLSDSAYNDRRSVCERISNMLNITALRDATEADLQSIKDNISQENYQKALYVIQENERVVNASKAIQNHDMVSLGELIYQSHNGLKTQYKVSCDELDFLVDQAKLNGHVAGARMMGGGFGGCTINLVAKEASKNFQDTVSKAYKNRFNTNCSIYAIELSNGTGLIS